MSDEKRVMCASFDVGMKNLAYCIRNIEGELCRLELLDIRANTNQASVLKLVKLLDTDIMLSQCKRILIEQQMRSNSKAQAIQHYLYMYFIIRVPNVSIICVPSRWKTSALLAPKNMTYHRRKKWAIEQAIQLLETQNVSDEYLIKLKEKKADDYADCILQLHAYELKTLK